MFPSSFICAAACGEVAFSKLVDLDSRENGAGTVRCRIRSLHGPAAEGILERMVACV